MPSDSFAKNTKGAAGVHLVVAQLSLKGYVALATTRNLKSVDIVAFNEALNRFAFIQVKTTDKPKGGWPCHTIRKEDSWEVDLRRALDRGERFFYVFVSLPTVSQPQPAYYVVPSAEVAEMIACDVKRYLSKPGRKAERQLCVWKYGGGPRPEVIAKYQNKWEFLGLDDSTRTPAVIRAGQR
jgi:hypothetical protein